MQNTSPWIANQLQTKKKNNDPIAKIKAQTKRIDFCTEEKSNLFAKIKAETKHIDLCTDESNANQLQTAETKHIDFCTDEFSTNQLPTERKL